jgi:Intracellular proteinase inhibitor
LERNALALVLVGVVVIAVVSGALAYYLPRPSLRDSFRLEFVKTGGIAGVNDTLTVLDDGSAMLSSRYGASFNSTVGPVELSELRQVIAANLAGTSPRTLQARAGAADYFGYRLTVTTSAGTTVLVWVDEWAVNGTFPDGLKAVQNEVQKLTTELTVRHGFANANASDAGGLRVTVLTDKPAYKTGEQVDFAVILENTGPSNVTYTSPTPCAQDIRVVVANGSVSQQVATKDGVSCIQVLQGRTLQGKTYIVQTGTWDMTIDAGGLRTPASPGGYTVSAVFPFASFEKTLASSSVEISVTT